MTRLALFAALLAGCSLCFLCVPSSAAGKKKTTAKANPAQGAVARVLRNEVAGAVNRRAELSGTLEQHPDSPTAHWQAGFVRDGSGWRSFAAPPSSTAVERLQKYRLQREDAPQTFPGQLELANWCRKQELHDQERAHLLTALALSPDEDQPAVLQRLGYTQIGAQWIDRETIRDWQRASSRTDAALKKWTSKFEKIAARLNGAKAQRAAALAELQALNDPAVIPALELTLAGRDETCALAAIEALRRMESSDASRGLAKQAAFSEWTSARKAANAALRERPLVDFVPALIALLATPAQGAYRMSYDASEGVLFYSYILATELENQFQVAALTVASQVFYVPVTQTGQPDRTSDEASGTALIRRVRGDSQRAAADVLYPRERQREIQNDRIEELNGRVTAILAEVTGADSTRDARKWWQWWYDYADAPRAGNKPVVVVSETEAVAPVLIPYVSHSCFAAGTPVLTEAGLVPIEMIKVGDRVLAKSVETGELTFQPVLLTTVNPPKDLLTIRVGDESIVCTKGHRFWISGTGWTMTNELTPQVLLHTATGNTPVWSVNTAPAEKTYNLVVDGFHTYFVGKAGILCQDLRRSDGANCLVPGLSREDLAHSAK